ncbi:hypothetical protein [Paenibacillus terrae]|uniref:Uncharacterized protein n=1 Tax=Paenibacillus terrae TaxID=159743 RepID=A0A0D7X2D3_9BACL|nr:hypothetical protein [Paenibacillus terrae]KJD44202.1 hypothetical protein QD47_18555 [Paenibacillus terrae]
MGTSIPNRKNETASRGQGDVRTYTLSPEELAKIVGKPIPKSHIKPLTFRAKTVSNKEEQAIMAKFEKDDYLKIRASGASRQATATKLGISLKTLESYWLAKKWDIKTPKAEEVAIARYKESIQAKPKDDPKPVPAVAEAAAKTEPITQPEEHCEEDEPYKPVLTKAEDEAIKWLLTEWTKESLLVEHAIAPNGWEKGTKAEALNGMSVWLLAQALIAGYTVELTPEETLIEKYADSYNVDSAYNEGWRKGVRSALIATGKSIGGITD